MIPKFRHLPQSGSSVARQERACKGGLRFSYVSLVISVHRRSPSCAESELPATLLRSTEWLWIAYEIVSESKVRHFDCGD